MARSRAAALDPNDRGLVVNTSVTLYSDQLAYLMRRARGNPRTGLSGRVVISASSVLREIIDAEMGKRPVKEAGG
jgi:hypothetical protein